MGCLFGHDWGWPRRRGDRHIQTCLKCGSERESKVQFGGPRNGKTMQFTSTGPVAGPLLGDWKRKIAAG